MLSFEDIVGQEELKEALLAVVANEDLDGLLIRGEKGTAKSTAVRALTDLLPTRRAVADCPYGCPPDAPDRQCADCREREDPTTAERPVPLVTLPLGATRERVVGSLSVSDALGGDYEFDPGLLARANRGVLYVDEVNLLDDHLVDVLLDAAASGVNRVERDGVSVAHPAAFTLVGTMNPEEGDLRPQLRDRFALQATVTACEDVDRRVEIIDRALGRDGRESRREDDSPEETNRVRTRVREARDRLDDVELPPEFAEEIAELCRDAGVEGHRGDIATARAAVTFAALDGRPKVLESDVRRAAELALPHRLQSRPFEDAPEASDVVDEHFDDDRSAGEPRGDRDAEDDAENEGTDDDGGEGDGLDEGEDGNGPGDGTDGNGPGDGTDGDSPGEGKVGDGPGNEGTTLDGREADDTDEADGVDSDETAETDAGGTSGDGDAESGGGRTDESGDGPTPSPREGDGANEGADAASADAGRDGDAGDDRTEGVPLVPGQARAGVGDGRAPELSVPEADAERSESDGSRSRAQPHVDEEGPRVRTRRAESDGRVDAAASVRAAAARGASAVESRDLRRSVRAGDASALVLFVVDASASMRPAMRSAKGTVLELLKDAYRQRDEVAFVAFAGERADVLLPPTDSVTLAARHLKELPTGDRTPLPAGLRTAGEVLERADPATSVVVLVTDGRANVAEESPVRETREAARGLRDLGAHVVVVDVSEADGNGLADLVVDETGGERVPLSALSAERVDATVGAARESEL